MTLIEMMIGLVVLAITLTLALPNFRIWMQNSQIRTATESIQNGLQLARNEALRRNMRVVFTLQTDTSWQVDVPDAVPAETVQKRVAADGASNHVTSIELSGATMVTFGGLGRVVANADASAPLTQVDVDTNAIPASDSKELRILVNSGGQIKMCAPYVSDSADPRYCQP